MEARSATAKVPTVMYYDSNRMVFACAESLLPENAGQIEDEKLLGVER
jgi:hypothetical protein